MIGWEALAGLDPVAPHTGPFPHAGFLEVWWRHRGIGALLPIRAGAGALALVVADGTAELAVSPGSPTTTRRSAPASTGWGLPSETPSPRRRGSLSTHCPWRRPNR
jgi:hypothetical protein